MPSASFPTWHPLTRDGDKKIVVLEVEREKRRGNRGGTHGTEQHSKQPFSIV
jgi:hypothetical protein